MPEGSGRVQPAWPIAIALICFCVASVLFSRRFDAWCDEIYTLAYIRHDIPFAEIVRTRWLVDTHPPLHYFLGWLAEPFIGTSVFRGRLLNLTCIVLACVLATVRLRRFPQGSVFATFFVLVLLGAWPTLYMSAEFRAGGVVIASNILVVAWLYAIESRDRDFGSADRADLVALWLATLLAFSLHFVATVVGGVLLGSFILLFWLTGRRRWSVAIALSSILAGLPVVAWWLTEKALFTHVAGAFWATTTTKDALGLVALFDMRLVVANLLVSAVAVWALVQAIRARTPIFRRFRFPITCAVVCVIGSLVLVGMNAMVPFLQSRYLVALVPASAAAIAAAAAVVPIRQWVIGIALLVTLISSTLNVAFGKKTPGWEASAAAARDEVLRCPGTAVHARFPPDMQATKLITAAADHEAMYFGYARAAKTVGLAIEPDRGKRIAADCPTIVWVEHSVDHIRSGDVPSRSGLPLSAAAIAGMTVKRAGSGVLFIFPAEATTLGSAGASVEAR